MIRFSVSSHQSEVLKIGNYKTGDLMLHVMVYHSIPQMIDDWTPDLLKSESVLDIIKEEHKTLYGNIKSLFSKEFLKGKRYDNFFLRIYKNDRLNSNYPKEFLVEKMNWLYRYISKHIKIKEVMIAKNENEARSYFYKICDEIDNLNNKND